jgi:hypothetical protein
MPIRLFIILFFSLFIFCATTIAQKDSVIIKSDSTSKKVKQKTKPFSKVDKTLPYNPRIAIMRSTIAPGWGQITNKNYWKLPIVYGALGTTTYLFFRNLKQFKEADRAYKNATDGDTGNNILIPLPYSLVVNQPDRIKNFRNQVRQNVDYSVLFFIIFWGLNVADAAVDAHLKTFDVSDDISLHLKLGYSELAKTNGISLVLKIGK